MEEAFPGDELRSLEEQQNICTRNGYKIYVESEKEQINAMLALWRFDGFDFIEHFAVRSNLRGKGTGRQMLLNLKQICPDKIIIEVEMPDTETARRRIGFYQRCGFILNSHEYIMPSLGTGKNPLPMLIMSTQGELSPYEFELFRKTVYEKVYDVPCNF